MIFVLAGGTGFIGRHLVDDLLNDHHEVIVLTRRHMENVSRQKVRYVLWDPKEGGAWVNFVDGADAVVNLCGESIARGRWSIERKKAILESRLLAVRALADGLIRIKKKPQVFLSVSAVGYYGDRGDREVFETDAAGRDFLANVCILCEKEAALFQMRGIRTVLLRLGIVLGRDGGALEQMLPLFKMGLGGPLASGKQWMPWIHVGDACGLIRWLIASASARGPFNAVAPQLVTNAEFSKILGRVLHRPAIFPVPSFVLRLAFGEMANILIGGQKALPQKALETGYQFQYPALEPALKSLAG
ncbi:MAG: TIGR01777 family protein [Elusimicrobia bacterium]|nr:TIGR01777 family protein [Elusimicrobiota bacterium]